MNYQTAKITLLDSNENLTHFRPIPMRPYITPTAKMRPQPKKLDSLGHMAKLSTASLKNQILLAMTSTITRIDTVTNKLHLKSSKE